MVYEVDAESPGSQIFVLPLSWIILQILINPYNLTDLCNYELSFFTLSLTKFSTSPQLSCENCSILSLYKAVHGLNLCFDYKRPSQICELQSEMNVVLD